MTSTSAGHIEVSVCVIGGGPAGSATARQLARLGHSVCLLERESFPRPHIGESLTPGVVPLLDGLGIRARIDAAGFLRPRSTVIRWEDSTDRVREFSGHGYQVDRGRFDQLLLAAAVDAGVGVVQPALVRQAVCSDSGLWSIHATQTDRGLTIQADFVVDATGRYSQLRLPTGSSNRPRRRTVLAPTLALYAYWRSPRETGGSGSTSSSSDSCTRVEAGNDEWFWGAPLPDGTFNATVFVDRDRLKLERGDMTAAYERWLAKSELLRDVISRERVTQVRAVDATCSRACEVSGPNWIKVGEAAYTLDPLSSQGVQSAIRTGLQAAAVVHTSLVQPENKGICQDFYRARVNESVSSHQAFATEFYDRVHDTRVESFWTRRRSESNSSDESVMSAALEWHGFRSANAQLRTVDPTAIVRLADDVRLEPTPVLIGDFVGLRPALINPRVHRPLAFLGDVAIADFLSELPPTIKVAELAGRLRGRIQPRECLQAIQWLLETGTLKLDSSSECPRH
ncbi:MAG: NAD(P)/FAD-dependent oxidoreductase [Planctomycetota bacterium]|nr:NAD(P)/FAD-dependent oxidoreductase [Planctomycetota bacterium]